MKEARDLATINTDARLERLRVVARVADELSCHANEVREAWQYGHSSPHWRALEEALEALAPGELEEGGVTRPRVRIEVQSIVNPAGESFVQFRGQGGQMTPDEARDLAMNLLQAAEAAEMDALVLRFVREALGGDERHAAVLLLELRKLRGGTPRAAAVP